MATCSLKRFAKPHPSSGYFWLYEPIILFCTARKHSEYEFAWLMNKNTVKATQNRHLRLNYWCNKMTSTPRPSTRRLEQLSHTHTHTHTHTILTTHTARRCGRHEHSLIILIDPTFARYMLVLLNPELKWLRGSEEKDRRQAPLNV